MQFHIMKICFYSFWLEEPVSFIVLFLFRSCGTLIFVPRSIPHMQHKNTYATFYTDKIMASSVSFS
ncbi:MAG: hypothetical protein D3922_00420 [Candidatus Electrothrix sp. AR1]|nr:hypothetical protein [Candidatus Electrothrix sp. AR1]